ncbi:hypothetical protein [Nonomuraea cavernae]|uniref:Uncharacterized protein n=1 Tax=Nonomuraea cavernae TaxID=2045107 RepID=A0A918DEW1_9ACTN|nr:hypothetical protein [Nonomuraea cavernae]MCA2184153.1 hypothetical protein [Nonomuraea cavernae]GGO62467.1 hypothetical protein GCM10012289_07200 [Nonomuraea cavernae]
MTVDEQRIAGELRLMAEEAGPVDALAYVRRARAGSIRRRRLSWSIAGLVAAASVVAVVVTGAFGGPGGHTAAGVATLPDNTPEQLRAVRECMPKGGPVHNMDGERRISEHGAVRDFRLLAEYRDQGGSTALVGSESGFVLCTPTTQPEFAERAVFTYWGFEAPGNLPDISDGLRVDAYTVQTHSYAVGPERLQRDEPYRVVAGRVTAEVRRVEIDWADGRRTDARVSNGFFIARVPGKSVPDPRGREDALGEPLTILDSPPVTVTAYGTGGQVLRQEKDVVFGPLGRQE